MLTHQIAAAALCLKEGKTLAYPTEAVWGLGCDPLNEAAFQHILQLKQRPIEKGVILLASDISQIHHLIDDLPQALQEKIMTSWSVEHPNKRAITWLLPAHETIPQWIKGNHPSVAVRVTRHPLCQALCRAFGGFIVSTSANPAGLIPAKTQYEVENYFNDQVDYLAGELGSSNEPSMIIDARTGQVIRN